MNSRRDAAESGSVRLFRYPFGESGLVLPMKSAIAVMPLRGRRMRRPYRRTSVPSRMPTPGGNWLRGSPAVL